MPLAPIHRSLTAGLAGLCIASCAVKAPTTAHKPGASTVAAGTPVPAGAPAALAGTVRLLVDGKLLSNNGGGIISDNAAGVISNNSGSLISNNGGSWHLLQASSELLLADAQVALEDAGGAPVKDANGKPLVAVTDHQGRYAFTSVPRGKGLVLHVKLHAGGALEGGDLQALVAHDAAAKEQAIDTSTSLGAAYVLSQFVKGSQAVYDKLPASEARKLDAALDGAQAQITRPPTYQAADLVGLADVLRQNAPPVGQELATIKTLLLGQAELGNGRLATEVPLVGPAGMGVAADGTLYVAEGGRVRAVGPDGRISTFADTARGKVKLNFFQQSDLAVGPGDALYVVQSGLITRVKQDGTVDKLAGTGTPGGAVPDGALAASAAVDASCVVASPDGTVTFGALHGAYTIDATGHVHPAFAGVGNVQDLAVGSDGTLVALGRASKKAPLGLFRQAPGGAPAPMTAPAWSDPRCIALAADGTLYVSDAGRVWAIAPDGTAAVIAGTGGPAGRDLANPRDLAVAPDGTLWVLDTSVGRIFTLSTAGVWTPRAGAPVGDLVGDAPGEFAFNSPQDVGFDANGDLLITESGGDTVRRFDGTHLTLVAGSTGGYAGDGGPATSAQLSGPTGVRVYNGTITVIDGDNNRIRRIGADGVINTIVGGGAKNYYLEAGERVPASDFAPFAGGLALDAQGRPYWAGSHAGLYRLAPDGMVEPVTLCYPFPPASGNPLDILSWDRGDGQPAASQYLLYPWGVAFDPRGSLYVADLYEMCIHKITGLDTGTPTLATYAGAPATDLLAGSPGNEEGIRARDARLAFPLALGSDAAGNLYVAELGTRAISANALVTSGGLGLDPSLLPDMPARVRCIRPDGTIYTVAGPGGRVLTDPTADDALLTPSGIAVSADGRLAIADPGTNLVHILPAGSY